jgi:hypothetical protein
MLGCCAGMGPYITEPGTPVAEMWEQQFGHLDKKKHMQVGRPMKSGHNTWRGSGS